MVEAESLTNETQFEFRIRFTRTQGFVALFEYPRNSYQWSGRGTLRIEPRGVHFRAKRRRLGFPKVENRFVSGPQILDVYRQAESIRVEFRDDSRHAFLNFWAEDAAAAANIVGRLPTSRTVESESATNISLRPPKVAARIRARALVAAILGILIVSAWFAMPRTQRHVPHHPAPSPRVIRSSPVPSVPVKVITEEEIRVLKADLGLFAQSSDALQAQFRTAFFALQDGNLSQLEFSDGLERWLSPQWKSQEEKLRQIPFAVGSQRAKLRALLIDVATQWQAALTTYVNGLRVQDSRIVLSAFSSIGEAERSERAAYELVAAAVTIERNPERKISPPAERAR